MFNSSAISCSSAIDLLLSSAMSTNSLRTRVWIDRRADGTVQIDVGRWHVEMRSGPVWSARRPRLHGSGRLSMVDVTHSLALGSRPVKSEGRGWPAVRHTVNGRDRPAPGGLGAGSALRRPSATQDLYSRESVGGGTALPRHRRPVPGPGRTGPAGPHPPRTDPVPDEGGRAPDGASIRPDVRRAGVQVKLDIRPGGGKLYPHSREKQYCHRRGGAHGTPQSGRPGVGPAWVRLPDQLPA